MTGFAEFEVLVDLGLLGLLLGTWLLKQWGVKVSRRD